MTARGVAVRLGRGRLWSVVGRRARWAMALRHRKVGPGLTAAAARYTFWSAVHAALVREGTR